MNASPSGASLPALQEYAAHCLDAYCQAQDIAHPCIDERLEHLRSLASYPNLALWEQAGAELALNGRGDDMPTTLRAMFDTQQAEQLHTLVCHVVEVGLADMYGQDSTLPRHFLAQVEAMLERASGKLPSDRHPA
ncbi:hypothetical protein H7A76_16855 [Pseudomonas sp. MSSRFD41]|uniref:hypothetical protein n=1 Tax=unclassified Pseudomonas TaxID=196821 RepID=UPI0016399D22|nr:hypothetical protein [Pseudomonas sp. MSSRFD41]MBC2657108.1 hypothetical protein [Pseudomonas sp. MSSRFD41]